MDRKSLAQNQRFSDKLRDVSQEESPPVPETSPALETPGPSKEETAHSQEDAPSPGEELNSFHLHTPKLKELIHSPDSPSRYLTWLAICFSGLALLCFALLVTRYIQYRNAHRDLKAEKAEEERLYGGWLNKQLAFNRSRPGEDPVITQSLGEFRVLWPGNELRVTLVAECTNDETCGALKTRPEQIRDLLLPVLQASNPDEVLNPNRKLELRRTLAEKLNTLKFSGKVMMIDFSDMTVEPASQGPSPDPLHETPSKNE
jgi:hypothetical protein